MRFDRESWRKLYRAESVQHRAMPLFTRGLRDYLIRFAEDDGTLLHSTKDPVRDLCRVLGAEGAERKLVQEAYTLLCEVGYLATDGSRLSIAKFVDAQTARSPGAKRQAKHKGKRQQSVTGDVTSDTNNPSPETLQGEGDETRRDETRGAEAPAPVTFRMRVGWRPNEPTWQTCLTGMVPDWALVAFTSQFVAHFVNKPDEGTDEDWSERWSKWVFRGWNDSSRRPKKPTADTADAETASMAARFE